MELNEKVFEELVMIRKLLTVLASDKLSEFNKYIQDKFLTTEQRREMYDLFDGTKGNREIGDIVGVSSEGVRLFAIALEKEGLIEYEMIGNSKCPKRIF